MLHGKRKGIRVRDAVLAFAFATLFGVAAVSLGLALLAMTWAQTALAEGIGDMRAGDVEGARDRMIEVMDASDLWLWRVAGWIPGSDADDMARFATVTDALLRDSMGPYSKRLSALTAEDADKEPGDVVKQVREVSDGLSGPLAVYVRELSDLDLSATPELDAQVSSLSSDLSALSDSMDSFLEAYGKAVGDEGDGEVDGGDGEASVGDAGSNAVTEVPAPVHANSTVKLSPIGD